MMLRCLYPDQKMKPMFGTDAWGHQAWMSSKLFLDAHVLHCVIYLWVCEHLQWRGDSKQGGSPAIVEMNAFHYGMCRSRGR